MLLDFDESKMARKEHRERIMELRRGIANNYPEALPDLENAYPINAAGPIATPRPVAMALPANHSFKDATKAMGRKLAHALYLRETGKVLAARQQVFAAAHQPQRMGTQNLNSFFMSLPELVVGKRPNMSIKDYGDRFRYVFGYKEQEDFLQYAAQFGHGIILWGIVCSPEINRPSSGVLSSNWVNGACGAGARKVVAA